MIFKKNLLAFALIVACVIPKNSCAMDTILDTALAPHIPWLLTGGAYLVTVGYYKAKDMLRSEQIQKLSEKTDERFDNVDNQIQELSEKTDERFDIIDETLSNLKNKTKNILFGVSKANNQIRKVNKDTRTITQIQAIQNININNIKENVVDIKKNQVKEQELLSDMQDCLISYGLDMSCLELHIENLQGTLRRNQESNEENFGFLKTEIGDIKNQITQANRKLDLLIQEKSPRIDTLLFNTIGTRALTNHFNNNKDINKQVIKKKKNLNNNENEKNESGVLAD